MNAKQPQHSKQPPSSYKGSALAKQAPQGNKLSRGAQMKECNELVSAALQKMADLLSEEGMPVPALTGSYYLMHNQWSKVLDKLETAAKDALRDAVVSKGPSGTTESGGQKYEMDLDFGGGKFQVVGTESRASQPDVKLLCAETGLKESQLTVQVVSHEFSKDKLETLMAAGKVTQEQVDKCRPVKGKVAIKVVKL